MTWPCTTVDSRKLNLTPSHDRGDSLGTCIWYQHVSIIRRLLWDASLLSSQHTHRAAGVSLRGRGLGFRLTRCGQDRHPGPQKSSNSCAMRTCCRLRSGARRVQRAAVGGGGEWMETDRWNSRNMGTSGRGEGRMDLGVLKWKWHPKLRRFHSTYM